MQFESLKVFCDVARQRSFSQAAAANELTQSAASQIVLQLEKRLGVKLIDRSIRPLRLTREGQVFYEGCKELVEQYLELEAAVRRLPPEMVGAIQVAAIYSVGLSDMSQHVRRYLQLYPGVDVHVEYLHPDRVYERVLDGTADFGLVSFPRKNRELASIPLRDEPMVLACAAKHRFARQKMIKVNQLEGESFIGFDRDLMIRREVDRFLREHGVAVEIVHEFDNIENIKKAIEIGAGVALLPLPTLRRELRDGTLAAVPLSHSDFVRPLGIIYRRHHPLNSATTRFIELLRRPGAAGGRRRPAGAASRARTSTIRNGSVRGANGRSRATRRTV